MELIYFTCAMELKKKIQGIINDKNKSRYVEAVIVIMVIKLKMHICTHGHRHNHENVEAGHDRKNDNSNNVGVLAVAHIFIFGHNDTRCGAVYRKSKLFLVVVTIGRDADKTIGANHWRRCTRHAGLC